jgi:molecular chaperone GrpE
METMKPNDQKGTPFAPSAEVADVEASEAVAGDPVDPVGSEIEELREELAAATRAATESQELYLRERAELENFKRRAIRDRSEALRYAAEPLARDVIALVDNLERAVDHAHAGGGDAAVSAGVELVLRAALETLQRHGVERIEASGQPFDPAVHEAVAQVSSSMPVNHVVEQFLPGYRMHDRLLRAAQVAVSAEPHTEER